MILTDKDIKELCINKNTPLIEYFSDESLQSESYDFSIGTRIAIVSSNIVDVDLKKNTSYDTMHEIKELPDDGFNLSPLEFILVSTKERLHMPDNITAHVEPRTRYTRIGLLVCPQHINSSFIGNVWIGVFNASNRPIRIYKDTKIAQFVFEELNSTPSESKLYRYINGTFQNEQEKVLQGSVNKAGQLKQITENVKRILKRER